MKKILWILLILISHSVYSQTIHGTVMEWDESMKMEMPVIGANVHWLNTTTATSTNSQGAFTIATQPLPARLIFSFVGYVNDTLLINNESPVKVVLKKTLNLGEVDVQAKTGTTTISTINPMNIERLNEGEILKAACCNLSEAFETNPTINVSYKDAVTGAKEIQLLGLSGIYSQLMTEGIPNMRGIAAPYGLTFIPGPWMESIQITKGSGSVLNGFESTTGQINVEFKKPNEKTTPRFYLNVFGEENSNAEINTFWKHELNKKWSTVLMAHGNYMDMDIDRNDDGFMDVPHSKQINLYNRWQYHSGKKLESQIGVKYIKDEREGGQADGAYKSNINNERFEVFGKLGIVYPEKPYKSIGNILQYTYHNLDAVIGLNHFQATERSLYYQSIFQNIIGSTNHQYKVGPAFQYHSISQYLTDNRMHLWVWTYYPNAFTEVVIPGVFGEYTYSYLEKLKVVVGLRFDYDIPPGTVNDFSSHDWICTPRLHGKYNFTDNLIVRWSGGRSYRMPYLFTDNLGLLSTGRLIRIEEEIQPEKAWNYGINFTKRWEPEWGEGTFSIDYYRTDFENQLIADQYHEPQVIHFHNLHGESYANSVQATLNQEFFESLNFRVAYKIDDVKTTYYSGLHEKPLIAKDRALLNIGYETNNRHWRFDYTVVREGRKQLISAIVDEVDEHDRSPAFYVMNAQVTKVFKRFEVYAGSENILDYRQMNPIIHPENPFSTEFDATQVWGPIEGRRIYAGLRLSIK